MKKKLIIILSILCLVSFILLITVLIIKYNSTKFVKPEFDGQMIEGVALVEKNLMYDTINVSDSFKLKICGNIYALNNKATIYLTSLKSNKLYIKARIYENKTIVGESGLIKPGTYLKDIKLNKTIIKDTKVVIKIMSYDPDTYYSAGIVKLNTVLKVK